MRLLAISDIHGRFIEFLKLLDYANYNEEEDYLINLGDMVDRGPDSYKVVEWFRTKNISTNGKVQSLFGNHENLFISYFTGRVPGEDYFGRMLGGKATIESYKDVPDHQVVNHINFLSSLPTTLCLDRFVFSHAGVNLNKDFNNQTVTDTVWGYDKFYTKDTSHVDKTFIYGHTCTIFIHEYFGKKDYEIWKKDNQICIDCTFSKTRKLLIYDVLNEIEYYYDFARKECYTKNTND